MPEVEERRPHGKPLADLHLVYGVRDVSLRGPAYGRIPWVPDCQDVLGCADRVLLCLFIIIVVIIIIIRLLLLQRMRTREQPGASKLGVVSAKQGLRAVRVINATAAVCALADDTF